MVLIVKLQVSREHIKTVKTALQSRNELVEALRFEHDKSARHTVITVVCEDAPAAQHAGCGELGQAAIFEMLRLGDLSGLVALIDFDVRDNEQYKADRSMSSPAGSPVKAITQIIASWLTLPSVSRGLPSGSVIETLAGSADAHHYQIYGPMLLFSPGAFSTPSWQRLRGEVSKGAMAELWARIANTMDVTRLAINAPIPPQSRSVHGDGNTLRSPNNLQPLHGDFGPLVSGVPTEEDFENAFWAVALQNGIKQVWAPRYTMFSRGNVSEKTRILRLQSVTEAVAHGRDTRDGCCAVDLYAGIGYFAFSFAKAGVDKVLCFEINPWSVEGLRRGALANRWAALILDSAGPENDVALREALKSARVPLIAFRTSNEHADSLIDRCRRDLPPIRHVNCGLLPSSRGSWATAVSVVDPAEGGWIHLHENIAIGDIQRQSADILKQVDQLVQGLRSDVKQPAVLEHLERVKTYAPGVMHCVLDIFIHPRGPE